MTKGGSIAAILLPIIREGTNERAIRLWQRMGFDIVGRLPGAFEHPTAGPVDALVMYQWLAGEGA